METSIERLKCPSESFKGVNICKRLKRNNFSYKTGEFNHNLDREELTRLNELTSI